MRYSLFNPPWADYVFRRTAGDASLLIAIFGALFSENSLVNLRSLINSKVMSERVAKAVLSDLAKNKLSVAQTGRRFDYGAVLADLTLQYGRPRRNNIRYSGDIREFG